MHGAIFGVEVVLTLLGCHDFALPLLIILHLQPSLGIDSLIKSLVIMSLVNGYICFTFCM